MKNWLKWSLSAASGFLGAFVAAKSQGVGTSGALISAGIGTVIALGNVSATAPKDKPVVDMKAAEVSVGGMK